MVRSTLPVAGLVLAACAAACSHDARPPEAVDSEGAGLAWGGDAGASAKHAHHKSHGSAKRVRGPQAPQAPQAAPEANASDAEPQPTAGARPNVGPLNVIVLSVDSLRADMPWSGYARPIAPRLTEFERKAVDFEDAYSVSSYTSMSLGGFLGGRLPSELARDGYFFGVYKKNQFFPKRLQKEGIYTMGVMAHMYFKSAGFDNGFDDWRIVPGITFDANTDRDVTSPAHEKIAEEMLGDPANDNRQFFFWAHFLDPHDMYMRHDGIDWGSAARDRYDGEVTFTDRYLGKLFDFVASKPWASRTVIIVTADHGEEFGEHGMTRHGFEVWNTLVHVPLLISAPGAPAHHVEVPRSGVDLAPTILEFFGIEPESSMEGKSLVSEIYGAPPPERDVVVDLPMTSDNGRRRALVHGTSKLICFDNDNLCKLFDLAKDPLEKSPTTSGAAYAEMKGRYDAIVKGIKEVPPYACGADCLNGAYRKKP